MTFTSSTYVVDGGQITGQLYRLELRASTYNGAGILTPGDLEVRELTTPGTSVRVLPGGCVIAGDAVPFLGSYFAYNVGDEEVPIAATDSSGGRSDMIIVQSHDPNYSGSPFDGHDPATDRIVYPEVIANVSPSARTTSEVNAIPLARIDLPASTATITQDMITSLRRPLILNPYWQDGVRHGSFLEDLTTVDTWADFPAAASTTVPVPTWANRMDVDVMNMTLAGHSTSGPGSHNMWGHCRVLLNGTPSPKSTGFDRDWENTNDGIITGHIETLDVSPYQGQDLTVQVQHRISGRSGSNVVLRANRGTATKFALFFRQEPAFNT